MTEPCDAEAQKRRDIARYKYNFCRAFWVIAIGSVFCYCTLTSSVFAESAGLMVLLLVAIAVGVFFVGWTVRWCEGNESNDGYQFQDTDNAAGQFLYKMAQKAPSISIKFSSQEKACTSMR